MFAIKVKGMTSREVDINKVKPTYKNAVDLRGPALTVCICGSKVWNVKVIFEEESREIGMFFSEMECIFCGSLATTPTPVE